MPPRRGPSAGLAFWLLSTPTWAAPVATTLVRDGAPTSRILVASGAAKEERLAATEIQDYLRKISGATVPIAEAGDTDPPGVLIRVGAAGGAAVGQLGGEPPGSDGFALVTRGETLFVVGGDPRGTLYGAYELLEVLGVRWFMPGELGEDVPSRATVPLPELQVRQKPAFRSVAGFVWAGGPGSEAWELRMKARVGPPAWFGHNWHAILPHLPENVARYPDLFAEVGGERGKSSQLCSAHPEVVRLTIEAARRHFEADPASPLFSISPNDGYGFCEDARCRAVDALYGVTDGTLSDRFVHYANAVLEALEATNPGKQVGILAYVQHTAPPLRARPRPGYATLVTHMPWEFCHVHPIDDPGCPSNRRFAQYVRGWTALTRHAGVYDYYGHFFVAAPWPIVHSIRRDLPFLHSLGIERFTSETQQHWANQGLNFYVAAKLAWNPALDVDRLLAEYHQRFYGRAAEPMRRYWERWEQAMVETAAAGDGGYEWLRMFTPAVVTECNGHLAEAERLAASEEEKTRRRVAFARAGFRYTEAFARMLEAGLRKDAAAVRAAGEEAVRRIEETKGSEPQAFFHSLAIDGTRGLRQILERGEPPWLALRP